MTPRLVILAGGTGKRMAGNKPFAPYGRSTLVETVVERMKPQVREVVIGAGVEDSALMLPLSGLGLRMVFDDPGLAGLGPLSGVLSALEMARSAGEAAIVTAPCDMPDLPEDLVAQLLSAPPAAVVHFSGARDYPLCALWRTNVAAPLRVALEAAKPLGGLAVMGFLATQAVHRIRVENDGPFVNVNRPG